MPSLNTQILSDIRVPHPENLEEQRAIAHILGTLDDKIELNRRMNQTLEEIARALFKSWFVDFDPVRAKATLKHHASPPQGGSDWTVERARAYLDRMDTNIAALFPDRFVDAELGPIPAGWEVGTLGSLAVVTSVCQKTPLSELSCHDPPHFTRQLQPNFAQEDASDRSEWGDLWWTGPDLRDAAIGCRSRLLGSGFKG